MTIFKKYSDIKNFLYRFTIIKIWKIHIRIHKIVSEDKTTLYHNHPFHYISFILKGGYEEFILKNGEKKLAKHKIGSIIIRDSNTFHRIEKIYGNTYTLFCAFGDYGWKAINTSKANDDGLYQRAVNNKMVWSKKENGIFFRGHEDIETARTEREHSIHQI
jgi:hypothetical protein